MGLPDGEEAGKPHQPGSSSESSDARLHVEPGGPVRLLHLGTALLRKCSVSEMDNNAYLLTCVRTGAQVLVDAADDPDRLARLVDSGSGRLDLVVTTHRHPDHHRALAAVAERYGVPTAAGADDADALPVPPDQRLRHGDSVEVGNLRLEVLALRGHTPGSIALALTDGARRVHLFTGDSLFPGGPGKTWSTADFESLMDDLESRVFDRYPDDTFVHPGHGDGTTLGAERPYLRDWQARGW